MDEIKPDNSNVLHIKDKKSDKKPEDEQVVVGQGHRERLRNKFLEHGLIKFTDEEALELLLTLGTPRKDCKQQARQLLKQFGSLAKVLDAEPRELTIIKGIGEKNILGLKLIPAVALRYLQDKVRQLPSLDDFEALTRYLRMELANKGQEVFKVILLNSADRMIKDEVIATGTVNKAVVFVQQIMDLALKNNAASIICAHNHPSGIIKPSKDDMNLTRRIYFACRLTDLNFLDHIIIGGTDSYSFARNGHLRELEQDYIATNF